MKPLAILILAILAASLLPSLGAAQEGANRAGLVVRFGDGRVVQACVRFNEEQLTGDELLLRSGLPVIVQPSGIGAAVCKIGGEGCDYPAQDCFCKCTGADCAYWALSRLEGSAWRYSNQGASNVRVRNGDVQGWAWGAGSTQGGAAPPVRSFAQLCDVAPTAVPATAAPPPTRRPTRPPTASPPSATNAPTEQATATSAPSAIASPTEAATAAPTNSPAVATQTATPEAVAALPAPTSAPAAPAQPAPPDQGSGPPGGYLALAVLLGALLVGFGVVRLRRR